MHLVITASEKDGYRLYRTHSGKRKVFGVYPDKKHMCRNIVRDIRRALRKEEVTDNEL